IGEHYLNIDHHLMVLKGRTLEDIAEVHSHPMALLQCKEFFRAHPRIKLVESPDTAVTAKRIAEEGLTHIAAIAPKMAATLFNLDIIASQIQTIKVNSTRFIILKKKNG